jgi:antitoxin (DNA-binding transcriptional repressor) of toxin-antitoxin stability system
MCRPAVLKVSLVSQVGDGAEVTVTDHGRAVARIVPLDRPRPLDQLIEDGFVTPAEQPKRSRPLRRVKTSRPVSPMVADQRR